MKGSSMVVPPPPAPAVSNLVFASVDVMSPQDAIVGPNTPIALDFNRIQTECHLALHRPAFGLLHNRRRSIST